MAGKSLVANLVYSIQAAISTVFRSTYLAITWPARVSLNFLIFAVDYLLSKSKSTIQKCLFIWTILVMLTGISLMLYAAFYAAYVPTAKISRPVYLSFKPCDNGMGICSFPSGNVTFWNDERTFQEALGSGQAYSVVLEIDMPDSQANRNLGMFMLVIKMYDREGYVSATSQRSALYKYRSIIMRVIDMLVLSPLYFFGFVEQKQTMSVEMFTHFVDDYYHPSIGATVEVHSYKAEIYATNLKLFAKFTGLKYLLYYWPILSAFCAFWINLFILGTGLAVVLYQRSEAVKKIAQSLIGEEIQNIQNEPDNRRNEPDPSNRAEDESSVGTASSLLSTTDDRDSQEQGTQTKTLDEDDPEEYDLPLLQEPADFAMPEDDEFNAELRHRRIN